MVANDMGRAKGRGIAGTLGVAVISLVIGAVGGGALILHNFKTASRAEIVLNGEDLTSHGVAQIAFVNDNLVYKQRCMGACDPVTFDFPSHGESGFNLRATTADGVCVFCRDDVYLDGSSIHRQRQRFEISGKGRDLTMALKILPEAAK